MSARNKGNKNEFVYRLSIRKRVKAIIETFRDICSRYPTLEEIALKLSDGTLAKDVETAAYESVGETGWRSPTSEEISQSRSRLGEALYVAALTKERLPENPVVDDQEKRDAEKILLKYPELVPIFDSSNKLVWSSEAEFYLGGQFTPSKRRFLVFTGMK